jgi:hypothetical protein
VKVLIFRLPGKVVKQSQTVVVVQFDQDPSLRSG